MKFHIFTIKILKTIGITISFPKFVFDPYCIQISQYPMEVVCTKNIGNNISDTKCWKQVVPKKERNDILKKFHDDPKTGAHFGIYKTYNRIFNSYFWPGLKYDVTKYVNRCKVCVAYKPEQKLQSGEMCTRPIVDRNWQYRLSAYYDFLLVVPEAVNMFWLSATI